MLSTPPQSAQVFNDLNGLQGIRTLGKQDKAAALMEVSKQFESLFVNMMMKSMRDANAVFEEDSLLGSPETDFYKQMYDDQMALELTRGQGLGLAAVIYRQLQQNYGKQKDHADIDQSQLYGRKPAPKAFPERLERAIKEVEHERHIMPLAKPQTSVPAPTPAPNLQANTHSAEKPSVAPAQGTGSKGQQFARASDFVAALYPHAEKIGAQLGVDPKAIVAQAALETGWGRYVISDSQGRSSFNFFGIKADERWDGSRVEVPTQEFRDGAMLKENARFRSYPSLEEGLRDYATFLQQNPRYDAALQQNLSGEHYGHALQQAGYATDPEYGSKIGRISRSDTLQQALNALDAAVKEI
jgi:flagellar protein FlgJ